MLEERRDRPPVHVRLDHLRHPGPQVRRAGRNAGSTRPIWARSSPTNSSRPSPRSSTSATRARWKLQLDKVEEDHLDWIDMLASSTAPSRRPSSAAEDTLTHAKAETTPAPAEYKCPQCGSSTSSTASARTAASSPARDTPTCNYASPVDREGKPRPAAELVDVACPKCGSGMTKRVGKFGPFPGLLTLRPEGEPLRWHPQPEQEAPGQAPSPKPLVTDLPCPICQSPLNLRTGVRGPWLGCSRFPKCRGRGKWPELRANPVKIIRTLAGKPLTDAKGKPLPDAPLVTQLAADEGDVEDRAAAG
jgi:ssDNA-binding Zn-finger/Zn-ribbon topoisomerase 1